MSNAHGSGAWIGVDLDGTLAVYDGWKGPEHIGNPILPMVNRVRAWIHLEHLDVRIVTARVAPSNPDADICRAAIEKWVQYYIGQPLPITHEKDFQMISLWDDRAMQVTPNTGMSLAVALENSPYTVRWCSGCHRETVGHSGDKYSRCVHCATESLDSDELADAIQLAEDTIEQMQDSEDIPDAADIIEDRRILLRLFYELKDLRNAMNGRQKE